LWELGRETQEWLVESQLQQARIDSELTEALLAQDFHDLTGQVVQCIARLARVMEDQFVKMPLDASPPAQRHE
jgi:chemotaxis protein CheZ